MVKTSLSGHLMDQMSNQNEQSNVKYTDIASAGEFQFNVSTNKNFRVLLKTLAYAYRNFPTQISSFNNSNKHVDFPEADAQNWNNRSWNHERLLLKGKQ